MKVTGWERWIARVILGGTLLAVLVTSAAGGFAWWRFHGRRWSSDELDRSYAIGNQIVAQLNLYKDAHGAFPPSLGALPGPVEDPPAGVQQWAYSVNGTGFTLLLKGNPSGYPKVWYDSAVGHWSADL